MLVVASGVDSNASLSIDIDQNGAGPLGPIVLQATGANSHANLFLDLGDDGFSTITATVVASADITITLSSDQTQVGGVINASGAGDLHIFDEEVGGHTVNSTVQGDFTFHFQPGSAADSFVLNTFINSTSHHNLIEFDPNTNANPGQVIMNVANATPGVAGQGNTFDFEHQHPFGLAGTNVVAQMFPGAIINSGFTSGGNNFNDSVGQLDLGVAGTLANLFQGGNFATTTALFTAGNTVLTAAGSQYFFGTVGTTGYVMADHGGTTVNEIVQLTGITSIVFNDLS